MQFAVILREQANDEDRLWTGAATTTLLNRNVTARRSESFPPEKKSEKGFPEQSGWGLQWTPQQARRVPWIEYDPNGTAPAIAVRFRERTGRQGNPPARYGEKTARARNTGTAAKRTKAFGTGRKREKAAQTYPARKRPPADEHPYNIAPNVPEKDSEKNESKNTIEYRTGIRSFG